MKVKLTGYSKHYAVEDEEGEYSVHEFYDANTASYHFEVYDVEGNEIKGEKRKEILDAVFKEAK